MTARVLYKPSVPPDDLPQCEAMRQSPYANDTPETDRQCKWAARYEIDGHYYCSKHAGQVALQKLLNT